MDVYSIMIPMVVLIVPAFLIWEITQDKSGLLGGAVLGIIIMYSAGLVGAWVLIVAVMGIASLFMGNNLISNGGRHE